MNFSADWLQKLGDARGKAAREKSLSLLAGAYTHLMRGYEMNASALISEGLLPAGPAAGQDIIIGPLPFQSVCEHHLLPFTGEVTITYTPGRYILGLGRFPRALEALAARLTLQENLTAQIADAFYKGLKAKKLSVTIAAQHLCLCVARPEAHAATLTTTAWRG